MSFNFDQVLSHISQFQAFTHTPLYLKIALANHCLLVSNGLLSTLTARKSRQNVGILAGFLLCVVGGYGGMILTGLIQGNGALGASFFGNDIWLIYMLAAWVLVLCAPFNLVHWLTGNTLVNVSVTRRSLT